MRLIDIRRFWLAALAACLGIAASVAAFDVARNAAHKSLATDLRIQAESRARDLQEVLSRYEGMVEGFAAAFPYDRLTAERFRAYVDGVLLASSMLRSGFQSLSWAPRVTDDARAAYEATAALQNGETFTLLEEASDGTLRMAARRVEYYPIRFVAPSRPGVPFGFDLASESVRGMAIRHALSTGAATATPLLRLHSGPENTLLFVPVFQNGGARVHDGAGGDAPIGVLAFRLSIGAAIDAIVGSFEPVAQGLDMYVLDDSSPQGHRLIYRRPADGTTADTTSADEAAAMLSPFWGSSFRFGDRDWTVIVRPTPQLLASRLAWAGGYELGFGLVATGLLVLYLVTNRRRADRLRDLAGTLQREAAVRRSTEDDLLLTQMAMDRSSEGLLMLDRDGRLIKLNDALCRQLGYTREELLQLTVFDINPTVDRAEWDERWEFHQHLGNAESFESTRRAKDGTAIPVDLTVNHFEFNGTGYLFTVSRDATARRAIEKELRATRDRAESASQAKSQFLANMSHELRTPLNAIIGFSEVISGALFGPLDARYRDYANDIHGSGHHLLRIINDLLDLSKIEAGHLELHDAPVPVAEIFEGCRRMVADRAAANGILLDFRPTVLAVSGDELRLQQVLLNLTSNAVKFTPGGGSVTVTATLNEADEVAISVADTGIGMSPEEISVALQAFGQVDSALSRSHGGTGLGLPLAVRLVELHGGRFGIESEPGKGTTITITFPPERTCHGDGAAADTLLSTGIVGG